METMPLSGTDALSIMNSTRDGYGDGMYGGWFWIIIILFAFWGNNGWGNRGNYANDGYLSDEFIKRDIFNTNQNVSTTGCQTQRDVLENRYTTQLGLANLGYQNQNCCCDIEKEILQNRYDNALQTNTLQNQASTNALTAQMQLSQCSCDLKTAIHAEGEETRNLITQNTIQDLRDRLTLANNAITSQTLANEIITQIRPYPTPAYLTCSPYMSSLYAYNGFNNCGCGCGSNIVI